MVVGQFEFGSLALSAELLEVVKELGFTEMTSIQAQSLPLLLAGKDLIGQSKTGSGKTAAFALPILQQIKLDEHLIQAVILCPTRELCAQVGRDFRTLGRRHKGLQVLVVSGGQPLGLQLKALDKGVHIVVGTPGRVLDLLGRGRIDFSQIRTLVLDEADRMLDMGFADEIASVFQAMPKKRQTVLFSATFPESIDLLSKKYQKNPQRIFIPDDVDALSIEQFVYEVEAAEAGQRVEAKINILLRVLQQHRAESTLIFCNQKTTVAELAAVLEKDKVSCGCLHGDLEQRERDQVMALFRNGSYRILVATDVAARGLDIEQLDLVVNFDLPTQPDVYVHRIGRTGRAGRSGVAVTLASPFDAMKLVEIEKFAHMKFLRQNLGFKNQHGLSGSFLEAAMQTLSISGGRKDKLRPGDILGALTGEAGGLKSAQIGKIEIHDRISYVAISAEVAKLALQKLREQMDAIRLL